jgi:hypothetical protein
MEYGMATAAGMAVGPARVLVYNLVEHIANHLALYVSYDQSNDVVTYAAWMNPTTINRTPRAVPATSTPDTSRTGTE